VDVFPQKLSIIHNSIWPAANSELQNKTVLDGITRKSAYAELVAKRSTLVAGSLLLLLRPRLQRREPDFAARAVDERIPLQGGAGINLVGLDVVVADHAL